MWISSTGADEQQYSITVTLRTLGVNELQKIITYLCRYLIDYITIYNNRMPLKQAPSSSSFHSPYFYQQFW